MKFSIASIFIYILSTATCHADISYSPPEGNRAGFIHISRQISRGDAAKFHDAVLLARRDMGSLPGFGIDLNSTGGSVTEAMAIGREIRLQKQNFVFARVTENAVCISSCVLILAGANRRSVLGNVGIHRPYFDEDKAFTAEEQKKSYSILEKSIKTYLTEMNVPTSLFDTMFRIPPEKVRYLTKREMQDYNLNEDDPFHKESQDAITANYYGLSKTEFLRRQNICNTLLTDRDITDCLEKIGNNKYWSK